MTVPKSAYPISGADPEKGNPTLTPASIKSLPAASLRKVMSGKDPSDFLGNVSWEASRLTKSDAVTVTAGLYLQPGQLPAPVSCVATHVLLLSAYTEGL